ncbi:MAG TPA: hypothetical protein PLL54_07435 [Dermatophilaceae bacterium]|nr:hypothetical protein [Dermatophilaceae bacterium]
MVIVPLPAFIIASVIFVTSVEPSIVWSAAGALDVGAGVLAGADPETDVAAGALVVVVVVPPHAESVTAALSAATARSGAFTAYPLG